MTNEPPEPEASDPDTSEEVPLLDDELDEDQRGTEAGPGLARDTMNALLGEDWKSVSPESSAGSATLDSVIEVADDRMRALVDAWLHELVQSNLPALRRYLHEQLQGELPDSLLAGLLPDNTHASPDPAGETHEQP